jgi:RecQ zinc-binding
MEPDSMNAPGAPLPERIREYFGFRNTLKLLHSRPEPPTVREILAISPLSAGRMKVCLSLFTARRIVRYETGGRYRLICPDMTRDELARTGSSYRERHERDLRRHEEMVGYAEGRGCRWQRLLGYFGSEGLPEDRCGHCDYCKRQALPGGTKSASAILLHKPDAQAREQM